MSSPFPAATVACKVKRNPVKPLLIPLNIRSLVCDDGPIAITAGEDKDLQVHSTYYVTFFSSRSSSSSR